MIDLPPYHHFDLRICMDDLAILHGDCRGILPVLPSQSVQCAITSPPYWGLRRYSDDPREIGGESSPAAYVAALVGVFDKLWRVLRDDGTLWVNLGDMYANDTKWGGQTSGKHAKALHGTTYIGRTRTQTGLPSKSLAGLPWRFALAMQDAGWTLRNEIIWEKPDAMTENVRDRFARSHEHVFMFSKRERYYFDHAASRERTTDGQGWRNGRTVWRINSTATAGHYATFPEELVRRCLLPSTKPDDLVLDPFGGSGTTGRVALKYFRRAVLIDLNPGYIPIQAQRTSTAQRAMEVV
jgi:site-specific DNA-methyltransferase (cytosine-N4-specific)